MKRSQARAWPMASGGCQQLLKGISWEMCLSFCKDGYKAKGRKK